MFRWLPYPFLRITPLLMVGIGIATWVSPSRAITAFIIAFLAYSSLCFLLPKRVFNRYHAGVGAIAALSVLLLGVIRTHQHDSALNPDHFLHFTDSADYYIATVADFPESKQNSFRVTLDIERILPNSELTGLSQTGQVIIYQPKSDSSRLLQFGDRILVKGLPNRIDPPKNPAEFNYRQYLAYQNIYHQQFLPASDWVLIQSQVRPDWLGIVERWRQKGQDKLVTYIREPQAQGIALAISLGLKSKLDEQLQETYAATGAMHVLAVSGLHVGIIYLILNFLLWPFRQLPRMGILLHVAMSIVGLWLYALLTGLSPSVLRAVVMFTFVIIGSNLRRQSDIYNTLACSAFILLWVNPFLLYSVSFQLSYLAVFGIVFLQPRIYAWISPNTKAVDWIWQLTSVSIAAQIATFPLGMYYFHQFPVYFWLSNLVVIPGALIILPLGLATLFTGFMLPSLATVLGVLLEKLIHLVNALMALIQQLPGSTVEHIFITSVQAWLIYSTVLFIVLLFHYRKLHYLTLTVVSLLLVVGIQTESLLRQHQETSMTIYQVKEDTHLDFTRGLTNLHLGPWDNRAQYHILPNHIQKGLHTEFLSDSVMHPAVRYSSDQQATLIHWQGKTVALIRKPFSGSKPPQPVSVDYVIVADNSFHNLTQLNAYFSYHQLIVDGTNSYYVAKKLAKEAADEHIAFHSVPEQGALTISWKP